MDAEARDDADRPYVEVTEDGPYHVHGLPLQRLRRVETEDGEPVELELSCVLEADEDYWLCRCGRSLDKPFCDGTHERVGFRGMETAPTSTYDERAKAYKGVQIVVRDDRNICEHAAFCGNQMTNVWQMLEDCGVDEEGVRAQVTAMVARCPSGALTYRMEGDATDIEPDLQPAIGVIDDGPYFVSGHVTVTRSDGAPMETRNRVTLCRCGRSANKPLCDGTHREYGFADADW